MSSTTAATTARAGSTPSRSGVPHDIPIAGYGTRTVNLLRLWASKAGGLRPRGLQPRRLRRGRARQGRGRDGLEGPLPERQDRERRQELRLDAAVFLRRVLAARHHAPAFPPARQLVGQLRRQGRRAAQRHASRRSASSSSCASSSTSTTSRGTPRGASSPRPSPTQPHAAARGAGEVGVGLFERVLPRHLQIIYDINARLMLTVEPKWPGDDGKSAPARSSRRTAARPCAWRTSVVGSHAVNGVAALHTALLKKDLFPEFRALPGKFRTRPTASRRAAGC